MKIHNLDEGVQEYFDFIVGGFKYRFRHLNTEESEELKELEKAGDDSKVKKFLYNFISQVDEKAPKFSETAKKMIGPQWVRFRKMIEEEYSEGN